MILEYREEFVSDSVHIHSCLGNYFLADCQYVIGRESLIKDQEALHNYLPHGGLYLLPQKVPVHGEVDEVCFLAEKEKANIRGGFLLLIYRDIADDGYLEMVGIGALVDVTGENCTFLTKRARKMVFKDDRLGIFLPTNCSIKECPLRLNLKRASRSSQTVLFLRGSPEFTFRTIKEIADRIKFTELLQVSVDLNIKIVIQGKTKYLLCI